VPPGEQRREHRPGPGGHAGRGVHGHRVPAEQVGERVVVQRGEQVVVAGGRALQLAHEQGGGVDEGRVAGDVDRRVPWWRCGAASLLGRRIRRRVRRREPPPQRVGAGRQGAAGGPGLRLGHVEHRGAQQAAVAVGVHGGERGFEEAERGPRRAHGGRRAPRCPRPTRPVARRHPPQTAHGGAVHAQRPCGRVGLLGREQRRGGEGGAEGARGHAEPVGQLAGVELSRVLGGGEAGEEGGHGGRQRGRGARPNIARRREMFGVPGVGADRAVAAAMMRGPSRAVRPPRIADRVLLPALWAAAAAPGATACGRDRPAERAARAPAAAAPPLAPPPMSHFTVPLDYDVSALLPIVERTVPRTFGSLDERHPLGDDARKQYAYTAARGPFVATIDGPVVRLRSTLSYAGRGYYRTPLRATIGAGCGAEDAGGRRPRLVVELAAPLTLGADWHLRARTRLVRLDPASPGDEDRCRISFLKLDVTDRVVAAARQALTNKLPDIDRQLARVDLTRRATGWWQAMERPIRLTDSVWLLLGPRALRLGAVTGRGRVLTVAAGLDAFPRVVTGPRPATDTSALPPLARGSGGASGFTIQIDGLIDYATASRALTRALGGRAVQQAGRTITVDSVSATAADSGRVALAVRFFGDARGTLRFVGTPRYDPGSGQIDVPDLDYALESDNTLLRGVAWLTADTLRAIFRARARVPVAPVLDRGRALLTSGLNRTVGNALVLSATVDSVAVRGIAVTAAGLQVQAGATGRGRAVVRSPARAPGRAGAAARGG
jgi:hypothetical protein